MKENDHSACNRFLKEWKQKPHLTALITGLLCLVLSPFWRMNSMKVETESRSRFRVPFLSNNNQKGIYWDLSCPWEQTLFSIANRHGLWIKDPHYTKKPFSDTLESFQMRAIEAKKFSEESGASELVSKKAPKAFRDKRKVLILGESSSRQLFISLACLLNPSYIAAHFTNWIYAEHKTEFPDAHIQLKDDMGDLYYAPRAGNVLEYDWLPPTIPLENAANWINACENGEPFKFVTFFIDQQKVENGNRISYEEGDQRFEILELTRNDVIVLNAGLHTTRTMNFERIEKLLDCIESATEEQKEKWPHIMYTPTPIGHLDNSSGHDGKLSRRCGKSSYNLQNQIEDRKVVSSRVEIIGEDLDYTEIGNLHVWGERRDCLNWFQPG